MPPEPAALPAGIRLTRPDTDPPGGGAAKVFDFFLDKLLTGELRPGARLLGERELALLLTVSRPVLREALRSLALLGLLEIRHGRGTYVRAADMSMLGQALTMCLAAEPGALDDVMQARLAIECQAIRLACERAGEADLAAIAASIDRLAASLQNPVAGGEADFAFHSRIVHASRSPVLMKMYEALQPLLIRSLVERLRETLHVSAITDDLVSSHRAVLQAIVQRDPDAAERRLRQHFAVGDELRRNRIAAAPAPQPPKAPRR